MKFIPTSGLILILSFSLNLSFAQTAIVLINEEPTRVELKDGEITEIKSAVPGYMKGFQKSPKNSFKRMPFVVSHSEKYLAEIENATELPADNTLIEEMVVENNLSEEDIEELNKSLFFDFDSAILSTENINDLNKYADKLTSKEFRSILLKSWYKNGDGDSQVLVKNRLDACRQYLETRGVASNIILTSIIGSNRASRFVTVVLN